MNAAPKYPAAIPTLDELARDPLRASDLAADALAALAARCAAVQSVLAVAQFALIVNGGTTEVTPPLDGDRLLGIKEAAAKLGVVCQERRLDGFRKRGNHFFAQGAYDLAIDDYSAAIELKPSL